METLLQSRFQEFLKRPKKWQFCRFWSISSIFARNHDFSVLKGPLGPLGNFKKARFSEWSLEKFIFDYESHYSDSVEKGPISFDYKWRYMSNKTVQIRNFRLKSHKFMILSTFIEESIDSRRIRRFESLDMLFTCFERKSHKMDATLVASINFQWLSLVFNKRQAINMSDTLP